MRGQRSRRSDGRVQQAVVSPHSPQQVQGEGGSRRLPDSDAQATLTTANFLYDIQEVVRTVIQGGGVKHLVTMATSEHMIMQNEALVALGLIAGLDLGETHLLLGFFFPPTQCQRVRSEVTAKAVFACACFSVGREGLCRSQPGVCSSQAALR